MVFSSPTFLFLFLPSVLVAYFVSPRLIKNFILFISSFIFYAWGEPSVFWLLLASSLVNYAFGLIAELPGLKGKAGFVIGVTANILLLIYFKYANLFVQTLLDIAPSFNISWTKVHLPIGVSFFTFQAVSYLADVYGKKFPAEKNPLSFSVYLSFFPQLIAGPIVRFSDVSFALKNRTHSVEDVSAGLKRFIQGLAKKAIIADTLGYLTGAIFEAAPAHVTPGLAWLGLFAFSFQIYFDFAGYSDMAIGLGRIFGFKFPENFDRPYTAVSVREFWRRWHMTLTNWFRDYVYIPLGGSRISQKRTAMNLMTVFCLTGLWHGANWTFLAWGIFHGLALSLERFSFGSFLKRLPSWAGKIYVFIFVSVSWIFFRSGSFGQAGDYFLSLFGLGGWEAGPYQFWRLVEPFHLFILLAAGIISFSSFPGLLFKQGDRLWPLMRKGLSWTVHACLYFLAVSFISGLNFKPFIYFRF